MITDQMTSCNAHCDETIENFHLTLNFALTQLYVIASFSSLFWF